MSIKIDDFGLFKTSHNLRWSRLNLRKKQRYLSRILDLGLETTRVRFTQLFRGIYASA